MYLPHDMVTAVLLPATVLLLLSTRRGEAEARPGAARFGSVFTPETNLGCCSEPRGDSSASLAMTLIVANAATPRVIRRLRVFIFNFI